MDKFVASENVKYLRHELESGVEPHVRATMLKTLVDEENKLGFTYERLGRLDHHIARLSQIMVEQVALIDRLRSLGSSIERPQLVLATLNDLMASYVEHRHRLKASLHVG